jgi:hypothetical protein
LCMFSVGSLVILSGCCPKYIQWVEDRFIKADKVCMDVEAIHDQAVRMNQIRHDGLMTDEIARVMWRSDAVVEFHERMAQECEGECQDAVEKRINFLKEENRSKAIFFVSLYGTKQDWSFTVCKDGHVYKPAEKVDKNDAATYENKDPYTYKTAEVKNIDLDRIYKHIFGQAAFRYRQNIYQVTFDIALEPPFEFVLCNGLYMARLAW